MIADVTEIKDGMKGVVVRGWLHDLIDLGGVRFIKLRDHTGIIQVTLVKDRVESELFDMAKKISKESVIEVKGNVQISKKGGLEIIPEDIKILSKSYAIPPLTIGRGEVSQEKRFKFRSIDLRSIRNHAIFMIQSAMVEGMTEYLISHDFIQVFTPCLIGVASESGSEVFPVIYFNREAFLRQDPQLHRQLTIASGFPRIFEIGPAWRAEQSHTSKHLCEHRVCAVELAFIKDEYDVMRVEEELIISALKRVKEKCQRWLDVLGVDIKIPDKPFPILKFPDIYDILSERGKRIEYGEELDSEAERLLWDYVREKYRSEFYFITSFPYRVKPFYVMRFDEMPEWARSTDLYFRGLELSSGGQREHRYEKIMDNVREKGMNEGEIGWFAEFFKYGVPPHGGFAIGIERLTQSILGIKQIRDCVLFPRDPEMLVP